MLNGKWWFIFDKNDGWNHSHDKMPYEKRGFVFR